jgi:cytochrome P450
MGHGRAMSHNEKKYPSPEAFMPERFLDEQGRLNDDKVPFVFGFGRRIWYVDGDIT